MVSSCSPEKSGAAPGEPDKRGVPESGEADKGPAGQGDVPDVHPSGALGAASALTLGFASQYTGLMVGMLQNFLKVAQGYNAALEGSLRERIRADIEMLPKPKPAEPPPVKVARMQEKAQNVSAPEPTIAKAETAGKAGPKAKNKPPARTGKLAAADDLKRISGIGPKLEKILQDKGLYRFSDIACLTQDDARKLDAELGLGGRILKDGWIEAAKALHVPKKKLRGSP